MFRYVLFLIFLLNFTPVSAFHGDEDESYIPLAASRLTSTQEHIDFLKHALNSAINSIMISSYTVEPRRLFEEGITDAIINAAERGVKVYIYYKHRPYCPQEGYKYLLTIQEHCKRFEKTSNHSKCILRDKDLVSIGSYNWLSDSNVESSNFSLTLSGWLTLGLNNKIWQGILFYQSRKHGNEQGLVKFLKDSDALSTGAYRFNPGQFFYTLRTPEAHGTLLDQVFEKAQTRVVLFSPFVRLEKLKKTLNGSLLKKLENRKVFTKLVTLPSPCDHVSEEEAKIFSYLEELQKTYPHFSYETQSNFHAKTLLSDNDFICEGSFNWLSAVSDIDHHANNFEMSIGIRGDIARRLIHSFEQTALGESVLPTQSKKVESSLDPKRSRTEQSLEQDERLRTLKATMLTRSEKEAEEAAPALFLTTQEETILDEGTLWLELEEAAKGHLVTHSLIPTLGAQSSSSSSDSPLTDSEDYEYDIETLAELNRLEQEGSSQPTFSPILFDDNQDPFDHGSSSSTNSAFADREDDGIYNDLQFFAELDRFEREYSSQPQTSSQPTFSPTLFDDNQDPLIHGPYSSTDSAIADREYDDIYNNPQFFAELDYLEQEYQKRMISEHQNFRIMF